MQIKPGLANRTAIAYLLNHDPGEASISADDGA